MNDLPKTELEPLDEINVGYQTADMEFVVACMARRDVYVRVLALTPNEMRSRAQLTKVMMHLALMRDGKPVQNAHGEFNKLRAQYQNREFNVDPRDVFENQRTLRSMILDAVRQMKTIQRARSRRGRGA